MKKKKLNKYFLGGLFNAGKNNEKWDPGGFQAVSSMGSMLTEGLNSRDRYGVAKSGAAEIGSGVMQGAASGAALGPLGLAGGAIIGGIGSAINRKKMLEQKAAIQEQEYLNANQMVRNNTKTRLAGYPTTGIEHAQRGTTTQQTFTKFGGLLKKYQAGGSMQPMVGQAQPLSQEAAMMQGPSHEQGGMPLIDPQGNVENEVEGGELVVDIGDQTYVFSKSVINPNTENTFAEDAAKLESQKGKMQKKAEAFEKKHNSKSNSINQTIDKLQDDIVELANLQEEVRPPRQDEMQQQPQQQPMDPNMEQMAQEQQAMMPQIQQGMRYGGRLFSSTGFRSQNGGAQEVPTWMPNYENRPDSYMTANEIYKYSQKPYNRYRFGGKLKKFLFGGFNTDPEVPTVPQTDPEKGKKKKPRQVTIKPTSGYTDYTDAFKKNYQDIKNVTWAGRQEAGEPEQAADITGQFSDYADPGQANAFKWFDWYYKTYNKIPPSNSYPFYLKDWKPPVKEEDIVYMVDDKTPLEPQETTPLEEDPPTNPGIEIPSLDPEPEPELPPIALGRAKPDYTVPMISGLGNMLFTNQKKFTSPPIVEDVPAPVYVNYDEARAAANRQDRSQQRDIGQSVSSAGSAIASKLASSAQNMAQQGNITRQEQNENVGIANNFKQFNQATKARNVERINNARVRLNQFTNGLISERQGNFNNVLQGVQLENRETSARNYDLQQMELYLASLDPKVRNSPQMRQVIAGINKEYASGKSIDWKSAIDKIKGQPKSNPIADTGLSSDIYTPTKQNNQYPSDSFQSPKGYTGPNSMELPGIRNSPGKFFSDMLTSSAITGKRQGRMFQEEPMTGDSLSINPLDPRNRIQKYGGRIKKKLGNESNRRRQAAEYRRNSEKIGRNLLFNI